MPKVAISIAHYPARPGARYQHTNEHQESQTWSMFTELNLSKGIKRIMVPSGPLKDKVEFINKHKCNLAIEIHFNSLAKGKASGCETLYYPGSKKGKAAANIMQRHIVEALKNKNRGVKEGWYKMDRPGVIDFYGDKDGDEMPDYFLKATNCTALIIEPEFIQNIDKLHQYCIPGSMAIAAAIKEIFGG